MFEIKEIKLLFFSVSRLRLRKLSSYSNYVHNFKSLFIIDH